MKQAKKHRGTVTGAWMLGAGSEMERELIARGRIRRDDAGRYFFYSQEAVNGEGELARAGDYFKVDGAGYPYPNDREWFLANHRHVSGDEWEQIPVALEIWEAGDGAHEALDWLLERGKLVIRENDRQRYFNARLWGADLSAAEDAVVVFYAIGRDETGSITHVEFNFVERQEFLRTYERIPGGSE